MIGGRKLASGRLLTVSILILLVQNPLWCHTSVVPEESTQTEPAAKLPAVVARVNSTEITKTELIGRIEKRQADRQIPQGEITAETYRSVLDQAINMELLYQSSVSSNLVATPEEIEATLNRLRSQFPDEESFAKGLADRGLSIDGAREQIRKDLSIKKFIDEKISRRVVVDEAQKKGFYEENQERMKQPEHLELSHILIAVGKNTSEEEALAEAERVRKMISSGEMEFSEAARRFSDDPGSKNQGGSMTVTKGVTVPPFEAAAFSLELEILSEPVKTRFGYHLIQVHEKNPPRTIPFEEIEPTIQKVLERKAFQEELQNEVQKLKSEADIEIFI